MVKNVGGVLAGSPNGSFIHIHLGVKNTNEIIINNPNLPYELGKYTGEYHIGVYCSWRLQENGRPITGSCEPNYQDGPMVNGLKKLIGKKVTSIVMVDECGDLNVNFGSLSLKIFCDFTGNEDEEYCSQSYFNWFIHFNGKSILEVEKGCQLIIE